MTKDKFLEGVQNWDNHRYLLWPALEATKGEVIEMGIGGGSTPFLHEYCKDNQRDLFSYENNQAWYMNYRELETKDHRVVYVIDWETVSATHPMPDVVFIDHAPGERRWIDIKLFANKAKIIVIHDSEPAATGYMLDKIWPLFKYRIDYKTEGAWATAVSNFVDVSKFEL